MSDDLGALADNLHDAILEHLETHGWAGLVRSTPWADNDGLVVEILPDGYPDPAVKWGRHLVPAEVWRDTAARPELVAHLTRTYLETPT